MRFGTRSLYDKHTRQSAAKHQTQWPLFTPRIRSLITLRLTHKPNVYYDMSGWSPKYFPETFIRYANSILKHKMLFGSDWPAITPDRWLKDFADAPFQR